MDARRTGWAMMLRIVCAAVFLSLGLAHHAPPLAAGSDPFSIEAFSLPDGSVPSLCIGSEDHGRGLQPVRCEVGLLCASALLPAPDTALWLSIHLASIANPLRQDAAVIGTLAIPSPRSRAPPVLA